MFGEGVVRCWGCFSRRRGKSICIMSLTGALHVFGMHVCVVCCLLVLQMECCSVCGAMLFDV
jgi:hypothetical protein